MMDSRPLHLLSLDPSSTATGWARFDGLDLVAGDRLRPADRNARAVERILSLSEQLERLIVSCAPDEIVIEVPGRRPGTGARAGASNSLATYGLAVGVQLQVCWQCSTAAVTAVEPAEWTKGRSKRRRQLALAVRNQKYRMLLGGDRGGDIADAIELGFWWLFGGRANRRATTWATTAHFPGVDSRTQ